MNFRDEREHDRMLISLLEELNQVGRLDVFASHFLSNGFSLGQLVSTRRRQLFDREITFENLSCILEIKVDSDEDGRWTGKWQTERIFDGVKQMDGFKEKKEFMFLTFGTSEFYTKLTSNGVRNGPASKEFKHIKLQTILNFVNDALALLKKQGVSQGIERWEIWKAMLETEVLKRKNYKSLLSRFADFRRSYLGVTGEIDFPSHRANISLPELAFPLFADLAAAWNSSQYAHYWGKVTIYPVGRLGKVYDSILNLTELWSSKHSAHILTCGGLTGEGGMNTLYFEINEDFNLHLKFDGEVDEAEKLEQYIHQVKHRLSKPIPGVKGRPEYYHQATYVLYEWDFGLLDNLTNMDQIVHNLGETIANACRVLK
ncbi:MAG: hypothetical protein K6T65_09715 [Peptococcaceae bacterium]|nr:hypothetical protein [Peptococcaceae bacterium]